MAERLTVALEDGSIDKLRTLAGGQRKVGTYLSGIVAWLWENREALSGVDLRTLTPVPHAEAEALDAHISALKESLSGINARLDALEASAVGQQPE